jgi:DTW domain-containing protein YfiP
MRRCPRCLSVGLVCLCLWQGTKAPPAAAVSWIVSPGSSIATTSTGSATVYLFVNTVTGGKPYDVSPARRPLYADHADRLKDTEPI